MTGDMRPYPEYKDSGVSWLGSVPVHWEVVRTKGLFRLSIEKSATQHGMELLSIYTHIGVRPRKDLEERGNKASTTDGYWIVRKGDLIVNKLLAWMGAVGVSHYEGVTSPAYDILRSRRPLNSDYYHYLFRTGRYLQQFKSRSRGIMDMRLRLYFDQLGQIPTIVPPRDEQDAIVAYLDGMFRQTNQFIRNRRRLIEVLNEQKQAIINRAVTRGLDPNVPLKPSGIDWLGDIPEHWKVVSLRYLATKFGSGVTPRGGAAVYKRSGVPFLRSQNVHFDGLRLKGVARIDSELHAQRSATHVKPMDVLLNITGASIGRVCAVPVDFTEGNVNQHVCIIRPRTERIRSEYLAAYLSTAFMQREIYIEQNGASREGLALDAIRAFKIVLPPLDEQQRIMESVRRETSNLVATCRKTEHEIELIREYRTRLIADVVTGKADVRGLAPAEPLPADEQIDESIDDEEVLDEGEPELVEGSVDD